MSPRKGATHICSLEVFIDSEAQSLEVFTLTSSCDFWQPSAPQNKNNKTSKLDIESVLSTFLYSIPKPRRVLAPQSLSHCNQWLGLPFCVLTKSDDNVETSLYAVLCCAVLCYAVFGCFLSVLTPTMSWCFNLFRAGGVFVMQLKRWSFSCWCWWCVHCTNRYSIRHKGIYARTLYSLFMCWIRLGDIKVSFNGLWRVQISG